ncbi:MAG: hypothetical protein E7361_03155 [Clostridiales bacterium]|nr:hypothetical protein [Clostridiales bacterium]
MTISCKEYIFYKIFQSRSDTSSNTCNTCCQNLNYFGNNCNSVQIHYSPLFSDFAFFLSFIALTNCID